MTDIDPGNPYSPHKSWNNRTEREELIEIVKSSDMNMNNDMEVTKKERDDLVESILEWHRNTLSVGKTQNKYAELKTDLTAKQGER